MKKSHENESDNVINVLSIALLFLNPFIRIMVPCINDNMILEGEGGSRQNLYWFSDFEAKNKKFFNWFHKISIILCYKAKNVLLIQFYQSSMYVQKSWISTVFIKIEKVLQKTGLIFT